MRLLRLTPLVLLLVVAFGLALWGCDARPVTSPSTRPGTSLPALATATPAATPDIRCEAETVTLTGVLITDPCPSATVAVQLAVAPVRLPIADIVVLPGPFYCNVIWPGVGSPRVCSMFGVQPGQYMHAWVRFSNSDAVAAVMLGLNIPDNPNEPGATRPPWSATLVAVEVPPAGWVMP